ncbi:DUF2586 family protein [Deinococcus wulumuqiensis]|uniref:Uncharacterized protein n=1 Tax=Deinococcus wulumuqiensis TaxID=980427 RepID=A0AAV4K7T3_9DEIO|nr:DUF2586 family protein [Deinococcus wulumuqiensis]QII20050.1 hypothetical protein G6R31_04190 [Deinococcus wulumuqiensis R12]GGI87245.1 hypothetical protein GCM10010914_22130 [Deinococcus wulumuqiensis]GGP29986.1 hypothetical protein GCM10008021_16370 [Deinococcus wulumuqiensis]
MTALSRVKVTFEDYNLGLVPPISEAHAKIGVAAAGPLTPQWMTRGSQALDAYQGGPLAGACAVALLETAPVVGVRVNATTQGTVSEVTKVGTGASVMTTGGTVNDAYSLTLRVTRSGTATDGLAAVVVSTNGNDGPERSVPASGTLDLTGTGLSVTFGAGGLTEGDTYSLTTTAPAATVADIITALETLLGSRPDLRFVHILGAATPALVAGVDAVLTERETRNYYVHALLEAPAMTDGERMSDYLSRVSALFANLTSLRVAVALDGGAVYNPITRQLERRSSAWKLSARRATVPIGEAPYRVRTGPLPAMGALAFDANLTGNVGRFAALRTYDGREGVYPASWPMLAPSGSDYDEVQQREVIDRAATIGYVSAMDYLGDDVPVDTTTGRILETKALAMETYLEGRVRAGLGGEASGVRVRVDREGNILSTRKITFVLSVIPLGHMKHIDVVVGFTNPMLAALAPAAPVEAAAAPAAPKGA